MMIFYKEYLEIKNKRWKQEQRQIWNGRQRTREETKIEDGDGI